MLLKMYYCLIYSHIIYGIQVWGSACDTELNKILTVQKKAVRLLTNNDRYPQIPGPLVSTNPLFKNLEMLKIQDVSRCL